MKIKHIMKKNGCWMADPIKNSSEIYTLRIYRNIKYSYYGCRYQLVSPRNERYQYTTILKTDSKEEVKMNLNLIGLSVKKVNILMQEKSNEDTIIPCSIIYLKV